MSTSLFVEERSSGPQHPMSYHNSDHCVSARTSAPHSDHHHSRDRAKPLLSKTSNMVPSALSIWIKDRTELHNRQIDLDKTAKYGADRLRSHGNEVPSIIANNGQHHHGIVATKKFLRIEQSEILTQVGKSLDEIAFAEADAADIGDADPTTLVDIGNILRFDAGPFETSPMDRFLTENNKKFFA